MTLHIEHLRKQYDDNTVVDDVSLTIAEGEFLALLGPSGCGKTTILRMIAGFERVTSGSIRLGDTIFNDTQTHLPPEARHLGMVFQAYALWPHLSVYDNIAYPLKIQGIKGKTQKQHVNDMLAQTGLSEYADRYPKALSGGQQQRVALARSLITRPSMILLDEPLANLDRHLRASMQALFKQINQESGITFVYVTHDQSEAMALADNIAVLNQGKLLQYDTPKRLYQQPVSEWVANFIGEGKVIPIHILDDKSQLSLEAITHAINTEIPNAKALVRPEHVEITMNNKGLAATVTDCRFLGERYLLTLTLSQGSVLMAYSNKAFLISDIVYCLIKHIYRL